MQRFIIIYLSVTGVGALAVIAVPDLVVFGIFAFVIPGIILAMMPTAFMYGVFFASGWGATRLALRDGWFANAGGLAATAALGVLLPQPMRMIDQAAYNDTILVEKTPEAPISLNGHIRFDLEEPRMRKIDPIALRFAEGEAGFVCNSMCLAALFTPDVTSVTINRANQNNALAPDARTYRLLARPVCLSSEQVDWPSIAPPLPLKNGQGGKQSYEDGKVLVSVWAMKLANDVCLVMEPAKDADDFRITERSWHNEFRLGNWDFGPGRVGTKTIEFHSGDRLVHRAHISTLLTMASPIFVEGTGGMQGFRFELARQSIKSRSDSAEVSLAASLAVHTNLAGSSEPGSAAKKTALLPALRKQLTDALDDPTEAANGPAFQGLQNYFEMIGNTVDPTDLAIVARVVSDRRLKRFPGISFLDLHVDQARRIYDAYTVRILESGTPTEMRKSLIQKLVRKLDADSIELIGPGQRKLLEDARYRLAVPELIRTLGYGRPEEGRVLFEILRYHATAVADVPRQYEAHESDESVAQDERQAHIGAIKSARSALCLLEPNDAALLSDLEEFLDSGKMPTHLVTGRDNVQWHVVLARMGKPIDAIKRPAAMSGTEENYQRYLRSRVKNWNPERC